ncbi:MAG: histidinol-phosphatase [Lachnospiraceae bacterium]|nr:histidinol-phosphatase [Lachnospiraceae bacterium]
MVIANYHTHTTRCNHAKGSERDYIETAIEKGFEVIGFSDHTPQPYPPDVRSRIRMDMSQLPDYVETLLKLRDEYKEEIRVLIGYEVEYSTAYFEKLLTELGKYPYDYLIMGQHFVPDEVTGFYTGAATDEEEKLAVYTDLVIEGMETGKFLYLAHPDLIRFTGDPEVYTNHMRRIIAHSVQNHYPLEVNMYGFTDYRWYPNDLFFSLASEMGASFVFACDAHDPELVRQPEESVEFMEFLNRNNIKAFENENLLQKLQTLQK